MTPMMKPDKMTEFFNLHLLMSILKPVFRAVFILMFVCLALDQTVVGLEEGFKRMGTKTLYEHVLNENFPTGDVLKGSHHGQPWKQLCHPIHYSLTARHGHRYPSKSNIRAMQRFADEIRDKVDPAYDFIRTWDSPFTVDQAKLITHVGIADMEEMGRRMGRRWHATFHEDADDRREEEEHDENRRHTVDVKFISSNMQRSVESTKAFIKGLKSALHRPAEEELPIHFDDRILRFFDECEKYVKSVDKNKTALQEFHLFSSGSKMTAMAEKVKKKLGLQKYETMLDEEMKTILWDMFVMCGAESRLTDDKSDWCQLLDDEEDAPILEYRSDLKHYWKNAYGYSISKAQSCPLVKDIFYHLDLAVIGRTMKREYHRGVFRFGHAETLYPLYSALGLFNISSPLKADNMEEMEKRIFRGSKICPFSANIAFVLYDCDTSPGALDVHRFTDEEKASLPTKFEKFMLQVLVNEKSVTLPVCKDELCPYSVVKRSYRHWVDSCNFEEMCQHSPPQKENVKDEL